MLWLRTSYWLPEHTAVNDTQLLADTTGVVGVVVGVQAVTETTFEAGLLQPLAEQVAEYSPAVLTTRLLPVTPVDQLTVPLQPLAVRLTLEPLHS